MSWLTKHESKIIKSVSWFTFLTCTIGFGITGYQCFEKFFSYPQGVDISLTPQHEVDIPSLTFCSSTSGKIFKQDQLAECGLKQEDLQSRFIGFGSPDCEDPVIFWNKIALDLLDLGIANASLTYTNGIIKYLPLSLDKENGIWNRVLQSLYGTCYTLTIPKAMRVHSIRNIAIHTKGSTSIYMFTHQSGMLNVLMPQHSSEFDLKRFQTLTGTGNQISYVKNKIFNFGRRKCQQEKSYSISTCIMKRLDEVC